MKNDKFVTINGERYNAATGLPVGKQGIAKPINNIKGVHSIAQKSQALYNRAAKKTAEGIVSPMRKIGHNMDIARSKSISHFASRTPKPPQRSIPATAKRPDIGPVKHPMVSAIEKKRSLTSANKPAVAKSSKQIKEESITEALNKPKPSQKNHTSWWNHRFINIFSISLVLLVVAGYFTYINMPSLSVRIASAQAGINATYPDYHPDGYNPSGPVTYSNGQVTINFHANTGSSAFVIKQSKSSWDSTAVKDMVNKNSKGEFITTEDHGLTIYTYGGNAAWVNGGILYTITGNAPLSSDQILRIATSL